MPKQTVAVTSSVLRVHSKPCSKCKLVLPITRFKPRSDRPGKFTSACRKCRRRAMELTKPGRKKRDMRLYHALSIQPLPLTPHVLWLKRTVAAKRHHKRACTLDAAWVRQWANSTHCPVLGMPFSKPGSQVNNAPCPRSPSLDRIDPTKDYTPDNTRVVSYFVNVAKNAWPEEQFKLLVLAAASHMRH